MRACISHTYTHKNVKNIIHSCVTHQQARKKKWNERKKYEDKPDFITWYKYRKLMIFVCVIVCNLY